MNTTLPRYASDEDVALLSPSDVGPLFPDDQVLAAGDDGSFDPSDPWTLRCDAVDFAASGLGPGHVVRLTGPPERFRHPGALVGVAEVGEHSVTLRRLGMAPGLGAPIAPAGGLPGVSFIARTLGPQLEQASREVDRLLGLGPDGPTRLRAGFDVATALRDAVVRLVLARRYAAIARAGDSAFEARARLFEASFDRLMTRLLMAEDPALPDRPLRFGTRLSR